MRKMKDSGIEWIGQIPEEWEVQRLQTKLYEINEKNYPLKTDFVLSLTNKSGVIPYDEKGDVGNKSKENHEEYKIAYPGTIVANSMNILIGSVGICNYEGCVSPVYYVFKNNETANLKFYNYILSITSFQRYLRQFANGILEIRLRLSASSILKRVVPAPSIKLQQQIVSYLDTKCSEIDSIVRETEQTIEEYKKLKQSLITEVVTGKKRVAADGLSLSNEPRKMKDSGVEWIGEIPEEWQRVKIRYLHKGLTDGTHGTYARQDKGRLLLSSKNVREEDIEIGDNESYISEEDYQSIVANGFPQKNDVLMCCIGASIGRCIIYKLDDIHAFQRSVIFIRCNDKILPSLMRYNLKSNTTLIQESFLINQSAQAGLYQGLVKEIYVVVPKQSEQQLIISYLDAKCSEIDKLVADKQTLLQELDTYKKSLIYECVTGKREVN